MARSSLSATKHPATPPHVLQCQFPQIAVERINAGAKGSTVVLAARGFGLVLLAPLNRPAPPYPEEISKCAGTNLRVSGFRHCARPITTRTAACANCPGPSPQSPNPRRDQGIFLESYLRLVWQGYDQTPANAQLFVSHLETGSIRDP